MQIGLRYEALNTAIDLHLSGDRKTPHLRAYNGQDLDWWHGGAGDHTAFDQLLTVFGLETEPLVSVAHRRAFECLGQEFDEVSWVEALSPRALRDSLARKLGDLERLLDVTTPGYRSTFLRAHRFLSGALSSLPVDSELLAARLGHRYDPGHVRDGRLSVSTYSQSGTRTGRLVTLGGPGVLTWPKEFRDALRADPGYVLVEVDLRSAEPQILARLYGGLEVEDIYSHCVERYFGGRITREMAKSMLLSAMYGANRQGMERLVKHSGHEGGIAWEQLESDVGILALVESQRHKLQETGKLWNEFGRPIELPEGQVTDAQLRRYLVNYPLQSTAAEAAIVGFAWLQEYLGDARPWAVIHDAVIMQVKEESLPRLRGLSGLEIEGLDIELPFKVTRLGDAYE